MTTGEQPITKYQIPLALQEKLALHMARALLHSIILRCQTYLRALDDEKTVIPADINRARNLLAQTRFAVSTTYHEDDRVRVDHTFDMEYSAEMLADLVRLLDGDPLVPPSPPPKHKKRKKR